MSGTSHPASLGKYKIRGVLGKGAMGVVYDGWDPGIERRVAIKAVRLPPSHDEETSEAIERIRREPKAAGRLNHPNIVSVYDYSEAGPIAFIVMEFVLGRTLERVLATEGRLPLDRTIALMDDVLAGLAYSHGQGVLHRDMKPANIMITDSGQAKIADFGISRIESSLLTQPGTVMGTPAYGSPEQFTGNPVDRRTDIYSCGVILFELLTGDLPFDGSPRSIMDKAVTAVAPRPSDLSAAIPPWLDAVVARAMARQPADRFDTATAFAAALRRGLLAADARVTAPVRPAPSPPPPEDPEVTIPPQAVPGRKAAAMVATLVEPSAPATRASGRNGRRLPVLVGGLVGAAALAGAAVLVLRPSEAPPVVPEPLSKAEPAPQPGLLPKVGPPPKNEQQPRMMPKIEPSAADASAIEGALAARLAASRCSLTTEATAPDGAVTISGIVSAGQADATLRSNVAAAGPSSITWRVVTFDGPYCPALDVVRPLGDVRAGQSTRLELEQVGGPVALRGNDLIPVRLMMPGFAGYLHIAYLQHDSIVAPQVPSPFYPQKIYGARQVVEFGRNRPDFDGWRVGPPFGIDMIVAVASTVPLFPSPLSSNQQLGPYLSVLQAAVGDLRRRGESVTAAAILINTRER